MAKTDLGKIYLNSINEEYSWQELDCFFRPLSIIFGKDNKLYSDIFLISAMFNMIFGDSSDKELDEWFLDFSKKHLEYSVSIQNCSTMQNFFDKIKQNIDYGKLILIPADILKVPYYHGFMKKSHPHFFIVNGYDEGAKKFNIFDNLQINDGFCKTYCDFEMSLPLLWECNRLYVNNILKSNHLSYFWYIKPPSFDKNNFLNLHFVDINKIDEEKILKNIFGNLGVAGLDSRESMIYKLSHYLNCRYVYQRLIFPFMKDAGYDFGHETIAKFQENFDMSKKSIYKLIYKIQKKNPEIKSAVSEIQKLTRDYIGLWKLITKNPEVVR